jgi:hypothetical protein
VHGVVVGQNGWPALIALAGLPSLPRVLAEAKPYAERLFVFQRIEHLTRDLAREALAKPAATEGIAWDEDASAYVDQETSGYPYFLRQFGQDTWNDAPGPGSPSPTPELVQPWGEPPWMTASSVCAGIVRLAPSSGTCRPWHPTATQEARRETSQDGSAAASAASAPPARAHLQGPHLCAISKGLIYAPEHDVIAFTVPGMAGFIQRQPEP